MYLQRIIIISTYHLTLMSRRGQILHSSDVNNVNLIKWNIRFSAGLRKIEKSEIFKLTSQPDLLKLTNCCQPTFQQLTSEYQRAEPRRPETPGLARNLTLVLWCLINIIISVWYDKGSRPSGTQEHNIGCQLSYWQENSYNVFILRQILGKHYVPPLSRQLVEEKMI